MLASIMQVAQVGLWEINLVSWSNEMPISSFQQTVDCSLPDGCLHTAGP